MPSWNQLKFKKNMYFLILMKGIILAGGLGSRLMPCTKVTNKHLLPVYDKPMVYYPLNSLIKAGVREILIVSGPEHAGDFLRLLGSGKEFGVSISYKVQDEPGGIAHALGITRDYVGKEDVVVILGDNIYEDDVSPFVNSFLSQNGGARTVIKELDISKCKRFGIACVSGDKITYVEEKPEVPKSNLAMTGLYMFDNTVFDIIDQLIPSGRGELEITDVLDAYVKKGNLYYDKIYGFWSDAGTHESLHSTSVFLKNKNIF
jgi:glucose-1-phosphate thymidylyltransferase